MQKKWVIGITAISLTAVTAIGSTLAYFTTKTQTMENDFTVKAGDNGLTAQLREPTWNGYDFGDMNGTSDPTGSDVKSGVSSDQLGINLAKTIMPGQTVPKDPKLLNTSTAPVYAAIKVTFSTDVAYADYLANPSTIGLSGYNAADWDSVANTASKSVIFYHKGILQAATTAGALDGGSTGELFTGVDFASTLTTDTLKAFNITVKGAVVQSDNITYENAKTELNSLLA